MEILLVKFGSGREIMYVELWRRSVKAACLKANAANALEMCAVRLVWKGWQSSPYTGTGGGGNRQSRLGRMFEAPIYAPWVGR